MTRILSLCSGYGGLESGAQQVIGGEVAYHAEFNPDASRILAHHWPDVPNLHDITAIDWTAIDADVFTAGYPCQPFSHAGKRAGENDPRHLWPHIAAGIRVVRPRLVLLENVAGHLSLGFGRVLGDLAEAGYDTQWTCIRAADVGAPHGRARVFIAATDTQYVGGDWAGRTRDRRAQLADRRGPATDARGERHGEGVHPGAVGRVDGEDAVQARERERAREVAGNRSGEARGDAAPDAGSERLPQHPPEPPAEEAGPLPGDQPADHRGLRPAANWGPYEPAIRRWEAVTLRPAPRPTEPGRNGRERLSPRFVEWMMGLPDGHVTGVPDLSRNAQLKALGNGVVPQQAAAAYRMLLSALLNEERAA